MPRTLKIQVSEELLKSLEGAVRRLGTSRSEFARQALRDALNRPDESALETRHREGYLSKPVGADEFDVWETEQVWPD